MLQQPGHAAAASIAPEPADATLTGRVPADASPPPAEEVAWEPLIFTPDEDPPRRSAPLWLVTFADMITLLLVFFVLILSFSEINVNRFRDVSGSLQKSLGDKRATPPVTQLPAQTQLAPGPATESVVTSEQLARDLRAVQTLLSTDLAGNKLQLRAENGQLLLQLPEEGSANIILPQATLDLYARIADAQASVESLIVVSIGQPVGSPTDELGQQFSAMREALATEITGGAAQVERDGARIVVTLAGQGSFYQGSADLSPGFLPLLNKIGRSLANTEGRITIEGHADSVPVGLSERFRSNWDLSGARSAAVADYLTDRAGLARERVAVRGLADTRPLAPNDTTAGRAKNRRIEIILDPAAP